MHQAGGSQFGLPPQPTTSDSSQFTSPVGVGVGAVVGSHMLGIPSDATVRQFTQQLQELGPAVAGNFPEDDIGVASGNRWPRQETLALIKIRSDMDSEFREATLKGPLWDVVARKLEQLGYKRSAKKCKEKFENVHKYYKRTKEGRGGRQDGKSYCFFTQLEALHGVPAAPAPITSAVPLQTRLMSDPNPAGNSGLEAVAAAAGIQFSSNSSSSDCSDDEDGRAGKKKYDKMTQFFDGLMRTVMDRQEAMQRQFLDTIERREQDRTAREESWRRQEMSRLSREHEILSQERAQAASRDAALIAYLQRITGSDLQIELRTALPTTTPRQEQQPKQVAPSSTEVVVLAQQREFEAGSSSSSRWPKAEVHALIELRSGMDSRYQEAGPKGPLWEEISRGMRRLGYDRSAKRCKEKWENINKYFKKVKESNKRRPEDAKTCPYFHQLDALYRKKQVVRGGFVVGQRLGMESDRSPIAVANQLPGDGRSGEGMSERGGQVQTGKEGISTSFFDEGINKPEDIVNEVKGKTEECEKVGDDENNGDDMNEDYSEDDDNDDDKADDNLQYKIQYSGNGGNNTSTGSFLAIVQ